MVGRLRDKTTAITGADSGMGQAIAEAFAAAGVDVVIAYHTDNKGARTTEQAVRKTGRKAILRQVDVRDQRAVAELFESGLDGLRTPFIPVNSAAVGSGCEPVAETPGDAWDRVIKTDLYGPFYCSRHFVQARKATGGGGKIINITSVHEAIPSPNAAAYGAAKGGLLTFTRSLALEVAPDRINVNAIAPGMIATPMTADRVNDPDKLAQAAKHIPLGRPGEPREVAALAAYLASADADYLTGQSFTIDGGLEMNWGQGA